MMESIVLTETVELWIEREMKILQEEALNISNLFWKVRNEYIENNGVKNKPILGCRVDTRKNGLSIYWFRYRFYKQLNGRVRRTNEYLVKSNKDGYSINHLLKYSIPEEAGLVSYTEGRFTKLRQRSEKVRKLKQWLYYYKKV